MHGDDGGAGRPHAPPALRHECRVAGAARSGAAGQAMRHHRRAVGGPSAAGLRHRQPAGARMAGARHRHQDARPARPTSRWRSSPGCGARTASTSRASTIASTGASISPKPVQPDLPMWIGGSSEAAIRRTARYGTGWQAGAETAGRCRQGRRRHQEGGGRGRPHDRRGSLRRGVPVLFRQPRRRHPCRPPWRPTRSAPAAIPRATSRSATRR